jgi:uncharacterized protein (DUF2141 family)
MKQALPLYPLAFALLLAATGVHAEAARLVVDIKEVREATGNLRVSLYRDPETFRKEDRALKVIVIPAAKGESRVTFDGIEPGKYALMAYHDENGDGKLNLRLGMFPTEGYALSNNPKVMGPPKFADSAFDVAAPDTSSSLVIAY